MMEDIAEKTNVRIAGGTFEKVCYWLLLLIGAVIFLVATPNIVTTLGETSIAVNSKKVADDTSVQFPAITLCFDDNYKKSIANMDVKGGNCGKWEMYVMESQEPYTEHCLKSELNEKATRFLNPERKFCYSWSPKELQIDRMELHFSFTDLNDDILNSNNNFIAFFDPSSDADRTEFDFTAVGYETRINIQIVHNVDNEEWHYEPTVAARPGSSKPISGNVGGDLRLKFAKNYRTEEVKTKGAAEVYAELGGAWGGAMLILGVCFMQKIVPGREKNSPASEVQVFRLRKPSNRRELLKELAAMLQDGEGAYTENIEHVENATKIGV